jgi:hypothetical protein
MSAVLGWTNLVIGATISAGSQQANMPGTNVQGQLGSSAMAWQTVAGVVSSAGGATLTITPQVGGQTWRVMGLFGTNLTSAATVTFQLWNATGPTLVWSAAVAGPVSGYRQAVAIASSDQAADYLTILIDDLANPDTFLNIPLVFGGPAWFPDRGISYASTLGRAEGTLETVSRGGQEYPVPLWLQRKWMLQFEALSAAELWTNADPLVIATRNGLNIFFAPDHGSAYLAQEAIFGRLKVFSDVSYPFHTVTRRRMDVTITERL